MKINTCHIIEPVGGHGGMNYYNMGLAEGLISNGTKVKLYTCPESKEQSTDKIEILKVFKKIYGQDNKIIRATRYLFGLIHSLNNIKKSNGKFCHLHFFQYSILEFITVFLCKLYRIKTIVTVHDVESFSKNELSPIQVQILRIADHFIVHNQFSHSELLQLLQRNKISKPISIIFHGNYLPFIRPTETATSRNQLEIPQNKNVILFFGQIKKVKGLEVLLKALPLVIHSKPDTVLVIAGKVWKDTFEGYQRIIEELGLSSNTIQHIRYIPDDQVDYYYSAADVVALPYKKIYQSGVLLMAMSYGCVTVSSRLPAMKEVVADGINGYMFDTDNSIDLAKVLIKALDANNRQAISDEAIASMKENHDWKKLATQHMEVYKSYAQ
ncbi:D-inositol 3-phosphate glycosyltransferase [compost metagenome]